MSMMNESYHTIVIGGGQAGLAAGYFLAQRGERFVILDASRQTGDSWRSRWDSLYLFTPSQFDGLPGMRFPKPNNTFPSKDEVAEYLQDYAEKFQLPIRHGVTVEALTRAEGGYRAAVGDGAFFAGNVIITTGAFHQPYTPSFASELGTDILQVHSSAYRNPGQIPVQNVLVVGAGNSGVEIALELSRTGKKVWLAGRDVGSIPADTLGKPFGGRPYWWFISRVLSLDTPLGRKVASLPNHGDPLIHNRRQEVIQAGIECTPRISGIRSGKPQAEDGKTLPVEGVIWATGFRPDYHWIDLLVFDEHGYPRHKRGVVPEAPGLYFVGLKFQSALNSPLLGGVGTDARYIVDQIARSVPEMAPMAAELRG